MSIFGLFSICVLVVPISIGIFLVVTGRRRGGDSDPKCGHCGYNLTGATENRCPECGRLFIDAGVVTVHPRGSRVRFWIGVALIVLPGLLGTVGSVTSMMYVGARQARQQAFMQSVLKPEVAAQRQAADDEGKSAEEDAAKRENETP